MGRRRKKKKQDPFPNSGRRVKKSLWRKVKKRVKRQRRR